MAADKQDEQVVVEALDSKGRREDTPKSAALSRRQSLSAYFTIAAAAFGLIRYVVVIIFSNFRIK